MKTESDAPLAKSPNREVGIFHARRPHLNLLSHFWGAPQAWIDRRAVLRKSHNREVGDLSRRPTDGYARAGLLRESPNLPKV